MKHTPEPWINGDGIGITGPNTPNHQGVTVREVIEHRNWLESIQQNPERPLPYPEIHHTVISKDMDTIAICVGPNREENAARIVKLINTCQGIDDPRKVIEDLLALTKKYIDAADNHDHDTGFYYGKEQRLIDEVSGLLESSKEVS